MFGLREPLTFTVNFPPHLLEIARRFRQQQRSPEKAQQVYLNTLAVYAVQFYCECMGVDADFEQGDSWNPAMQTLLDTADLVLSEGILECRPILPGEQVCAVPSEAQENRKGYVVVEVDTQASEAKLIGFAKTVSRGLLQRSELRSLEDLIDEVVAAQPTVSMIESAAESVEQMSAKLSNWLNDRFEDLWQPSGMVLSPSYRGMSAVGDEPSETGTLRERAKLLTVGDRSVALAVQVDSVDERTLAVLLKVYPAGESTLPTGLVLELLDDALEVAMYTTAGAADNFRALSFEIETEEVFSVRIAIGEESTIEQFVS